VDCPSQPGTVTGPLAAGRRRLGRAAAAAVAVAGRGPGAADCHD
jgi:hypothetical protein